MNAATQDTVNQLAAMALNLGCTVQIQDDVRGCSQ